ncbi:MAG: phage head closure protein [Burkholderiaceae bacterium]
MQAGKLNRRIQFQKMGTGEDELGEPIPGDWEKHADAWASILHKSGLETIKSDAEVSTTKASIRTRYRTDILPGMRIVHGSVVYDILSIMPDEAGKEFTDFACQTGANNG